MLQLSAIIISKNEENMIADCLESVQFCDEILLIDNDSTDRTIEIAQRMNAKIVPSKEASFAKLRNIGFAKAKGKWILYLDADERISEDLKKEILRQIEDKKNPNSAMFVRRRNYYFGNHLWPKSEKIARIFKRAEFAKWSGELHESPVFKGRAVTLSGDLNHYTHRDLTSMLEKTNKWSEIEARLRFEANHPRMSWWRFPRVMVSSFIEYFFKQQGYKIGMVGLIESLFQMYSAFVTYAKLWEMQEEKK